ncbi:hypothetical protein B0H13DRAFT_2351969 [Mycena leptocephala]|nr:hypothetical protein B0H13DRAFT_2351969 [Mycena leptocephala]
MPITGVRYDAGSSGALAVDADSRRCCLGAGQDLRAGGGECASERENHDLHRMLSETTDPRRPMIPFNVVPRTRNCDDASPDREYKRRKIDTSGDEAYMHAEPHRLLARRPGRPPPLTVPDSPLHPHLHHYDSVPVPVPVSTNPPFSLDPALHLPDARPGPIEHHNGNGNGPALYLSDSPSGRATYDERDHGHGAPLSRPYTQHEVGRDHAHGDTLPLFKFSHPHPTRARPSISMGMCTSRTAGTHAPRASAARAQRGWGHRCKPASRLATFLLFVGPQLAASTIRAWPSVVYGSLVSSRRPTSAPQRWRSWSSAYIINGFPDTKRIAASQF